MRYSFYKTVLKKLTALLKNNVIWSFLHLQLFDGRKCFHWCGFSRKYRCQETWKCFMLINFEFREVSEKCLKIISSCNFMIYLVLCIYQTRNEPYELNLFSANDLTLSKFWRHSAQLLPEKISITSGINLMVKRQISYIS